MSDDVAAQQLLGRWITDPEDHFSYAQYGQVTLTFTNDQHLIYSISTESRVQVILLTYHVHDGNIVTDQPSQPRQECTAFELNADGKLILHYGKYSAVYVRLAGSAPESRP